MSDQESIIDYFNQIQTLVNSMKAYNEVLSNRQIVDKVMRILTPYFDHIVVTIKESKDLDSMKVEY